MDKERRNQITEAQVEMNKHYKDIGSISQLNIGDIVRGKLTGTTYIVTANYGNRVTAVTAADLTNADEWELYSR